MLSLSCVLFRKGLDVLHAIVHIPDINFHDAIQLMMAYGCKEAFAKKVIALSDGRLVLIMQAINIV